MRLNRLYLSAVPTWTLLVLWTLGIALSAIPEPGVDRGSPVFHLQATYEDIENMPVLATQDWRQTVSVRVETSPSQSKNNDLKKFHAAFADPAFRIAPSSLQTRRDALQPVPESWYGFSFSSRAPPSAA